MRSKWVSYERGNFTVVQRSDERQPKGWLYVGPATPAERDAEIERRAEKQRRIDAHLALQARPETKDADAIRGMIEMQLGEIIDRLTPNEWRALRAKLEGQ